MMVAHGVGTPIALNAEGAVADWIMLLPAGKSLPTVDNRGPWLVDDAGKLATLSMQGAERLPVDENHATDLAAPRGEPAPARGWIVEMQSRPDGIFGRVEWNQTGAALLAERAYRFISAVLAVDKGNRVLRILRASLTNTPNVRGMEALNSEETTMDWLAKQRKMLGLADDADEAAVMAKLESICGTSTAMQSIATAAGLKVDADPANVLNAVISLASAAKNVPGAEVVTALQSELTSVTTRLNTMMTERATDRATAFVDAAIKAGRVSVRPLRDHYIKRHLTDPAGVETEINSFAMLGPSGATQDPPVVKDSKVQLNSDQLAIAKLIGTDPDAYAKTLAAEQNAA